MAEPKKKKKKERGCHLRFILILYRFQKKNPDIMDDVKRIFWLHLKRTLGNLTMTNYSKPSKYDPCECIRKL